MHRSIAVSCGALIPALLAAHPGHVHRVMGVVQAVDAQRIQVKDLGGKLIPCLITPETRFLRADLLVPVPGIQVGERILIDAEAKAEGLVAIKVKLAKRW